MRNNITRHSRPRPHPSKKISIALIIATGAFAIAAGYVGVDTWMTYNKSKTAASQEKSSGDVQPDKAAEGKEEAVPEVSAVAKYEVAPNLPRLLTIDKLHISARVLPMGVNSDNSMQSPRNIFDTGWYNASAKPGDDGAMFINAHASGPTREGLFAYLDTLVVGDKIKVEKGEGAVLSYRVVHTEVVDLTTVDMKKVLQPYGDVKKGLNLMTCTGKWLADKATYDQRVVVWTEQI